MKNPTRTCAGCGAKRTKSEMIRVGLDKNGHPVITRMGKQSGRGAYVCVNPECVDRARASGGLCRVLRRDVPPSIYGELGLEIGYRQKVASG